MMLLQKKSQSLASSYIFSSFKDMVSLLSLPSPSVKICLQLLLKCDKRVHMSINIKVLKSSELFAAKSLWLHWEAFMCVCVCVWEVCPSSLTPYGEKQQDWWVYYLRSVFVLSAVTKTEAPDPLHNSLETRQCRSHTLISSFSFGDRQLCNNKSSY